MTSASLQADLRAEVEDLLARNGYSQVESPVSVGGVALDVEGLWEGPLESLDLSLIADRPDTRESALRLFWSVQRLTRALDSAMSRRTVTVVLIGRRASHKDIGVLLELARVLIVDGSLPTARMIGPLLKLRLPVTATEQLDGIGQVAAAVVRKRNGTALLGLVKAASAGARAVNERYEAWIEESFANGGNDHD